MDQYLINFKNVKWENPTLGIHSKTYIKDNQKIRLIEFSDEFVEKDWCTNGHIGYVLEGRISINFNGEKLVFKKGDGLYIPEGEKSKHKGEVAKGEKALLILFEKS